MRLRSLAGALALGAALALAGTRGVPAQSRSFDDLVVAVVNGEEITRRQLVARLIEYQGEDALQKMVNRTMVLQAARRLQVSVGDEETTRKLQEIRKQFKTDEEYQTVLGRSGISEKQHRDEVRFTLLLQKVALKEQPITDEDLVQYEVRMITGPDRATLEKVVKELDGGADFRKLASERSPDPNLRAAAGRLRLFLKIEMLDVWRALNDQQVKPGGYTRMPVLLTTSNWAILKLENRVPVSAASAAERDRLQALVTRYRMDQWLLQARTAASVQYPVPLAAVIQERK